MSHALLSWLTFLCIGGIMGFVRYSGIADPTYTAMLQVYGPYVVVIFHIVIVLAAFQDSAFQGILCLVIPLYSLYYLFVISDEFYLRAILAGILVGVGQDTAIFFQREGGDIIASVGGWIRSGG